MARRRRTGLAALLPVAVLPVAVLLSGCGSVPSAINPVSWWHSLQGGAIAEQRPPPPGATDPYPNLATVPAAPAQPDRVALQHVTDQLVADRINAQHEAAAAPLADPSSPAASPTLFGTGTTPPPGPPGATLKPGSTAAGAAPAAAPTASASMPAAAAPPPPPVAPPARAPVAAVAAAPLAAPAGATPTATPGAPPGAPLGTAPAAGAAAVASLGPPGSTPAEATPLPPIGNAPPPMPVVPGFAVPQSTPPQSTPSPGAPPAPATTSGDAVTVPFPAGSALLPTSANGTLKAFAAKRGNATIAVVGYGDAIDATPAAQSTALTLGLARAQAMAAALTASGVPAGSVEIAAQATGGRGASAHLVQ